MEVPSRQITWWWAIILGPFFKNFLVLVVPGTSVYSSWINFCAGRKNVFNTDKINTITPNATVVFSSKNELVAACPVVKAVKMVMARLIGMEMLFQKAQYLCIINDRHGLKITRSTSTSTFAINHGDECPTGRCPCSVLQTSCLFFRNVLKQFGPFLIKMAIMVDERSLQACIVQQSSSLLNLVSVVSPGTCCVKADQRSRSVASVLHRSKKTRSPPSSCIFWSAPWMKFTQHLWSGPHFVNIYCEKWFSADHVLHLDWNDFYWPAAVLTFMLIPLHSISTRGASHAKGCIGDDPMVDSLGTLLSSCKFRPIAK